MTPGFESYLPMMMANIMLPSVKSVTKLISPKERITLTKRTKPGKNRKTDEFVLTVGRPNYEQRQRIKRLQGLKSLWPALGVEIKRIKCK